MQVEIWSDVVCPWCAIGKRRFEAALAGFPHRDKVEVVWRAFELDPGAPPSPDTGGGYEQRLARKYGVPVEQAAEMTAAMTRAAAGEGLDFRFDRARPGRTFDAHRLLHHAREVAGAAGQGALTERLLQATFTEGAPVSDRATLATLAAEAGLDRAAAEAVLASDRYADAVRADEARAARLGIGGVPFFVLDGRYGVSGAQPAEVLRGALEQAWSAAREPAGVAAGSGAAPGCEGDACAV